MTEEMKRKHEAIFVGLLSSFVLGLIRIHQARITFNNIIIAIRNYRIRPPEDTEGHIYHDVLEAIKNISFKEYDSFLYISRISHLVYATTLFDTFLTDCTKFLTCMFPKSIGKQSVSVDSLLGTRNMSDLINNAIEKKMRDISFLPFNERIEYLKNTFGLKIDIAQKTLDFLNHYSTKRNIIVHDQGIFNVEIDCKEEMTLKQKTCTLHPTPVKAEDINVAFDAYEEVVGKIIKSIISQVIKSEDSEISKKFIGLFEHGKNESEWDIK